MDYKKEFKEYSFPIQELLAKHFPDHKVKHSKVLDAMFESIGFKRFTEFDTQFNVDHIGLTTIFFYDHLGIDPNDNIKGANIIDEYLMLMVRRMVDGVSRSTTSDDQIQPFFTTLWSEDDYHLKYPLFMDDIAKEYNELSFQYNYDSLNVESSMKAIIKLNKLIDQSKNLFIDAIRMRGHLHIDKIGDLKKGRSDIKKAYDLCVNAIPKQFRKGEQFIRWGFIENRDFHRAYWAWANQLVIDGKESEAIEIYKEMLEYDPEDHCGVRERIDELERV